LPLPWPRINEPIKGFLGLGLGPKHDVEVLLQTQNSLLYPPTLQLAFVVVQRLGPLGKHWLLTELVLLADEQTHQRTHPDMGCADHEGTGLGIDGTVLV